jgi:hypothetical protein
MSCRYIHPPIHPSIHQSIHTHIHIHIHIRTPRLVVPRVDQAAAQGGRGIADRGGNALDDGLCNLVMFVCVPDRSSCFKLQCKGGKKRGRGTATATATPCICECRSIKNGSIRPVFDSFINKKKDKNKKQRTHRQDLVDANAALG